MSELAPAGAPRDDAPTGALASPGTRVLLTGTGSHATGSTLPTVAAVAPTVVALGQVLVERCGADPAGLLSVIDPPDPLALGKALARTASEATDVLLFYYVGHGLVGADGELHLATRATDGDSRSLAYQALPFAAVRDLLQGCRARAIVTVLDCCFAGRAQGPVGAPSDDGFATAQVRGSYLLAAAARDEQALAPAGEQLTAFSDALIRLLREGDPRGPRLLTLGHAYRYLSQVLPARGLPGPRRSADGLADDLALAPNAAYQHLTPSRPSQPTPDATASRSRPETREDDAEQRSPYPGLAAFGPQDAPFFFGRERLVTELAAACALPGPVAVIGPSGSGKSSLLRAGLIAALEHGSLPILGARTWLPVVFTPGSAPLAALSAALSVAAGTPPGEIETRLREDPAHLAAVLASIATARAGESADGQVRVALLADQFEELFTLCQDEDECSAFIDALCAACAAPAPPEVPLGRPQASAPEPDASAPKPGASTPRPAASAPQPGASTSQPDVSAPEPGASAPQPDASTPEPAALVVFALRADCYGQCMRYAPLLAALQQRQILVAPMTVDELRDAIEKPAGTAGYALEPGLTGLLLRDLRSGDPVLAGESALPLLSYALLSTWQRREGGELTMAGYQAAGGIWDAVAQAAERLYGRLPATGQAAVRAILLAMVRFGDGTEDTRRSADLDELMNARFGGDTTAFRQARDELAAARLITLGSGGATMTHEALLRAWPRLRDWIDADRASLLLQQRFADAAATWQRTDRDPGALYGGTLLADALRWAADRGGLSPLEQEFLNASSDAELAGQRAARRLLRRTQAALAALAALLLVSLTLTVVAVRAHTSAVANARRAQSQASANQGLVLRDTDPQHAALLALAAWQTQHNATARGSLLSLAIDSYRGSLPYPGFVYAAAVSPDGRYIATAASTPSAAGRNDPTVRLWDSRTHRQLAALQTGYTLSVAFSPDGRTLAAAVLSKRAVQLWNVTTRRVIRIVTGPGASALAFSPDGRLLAVAEGDREVHLLNPATGAQVAVLPDGFRIVMSLAFSPHGRLLAVGGEVGGTTFAQDRGLTQVWDVRTRTSVARLPSAGANIVNSVAFSRDGRLLASAGNASLITLWDPVTGRVLPPLAGLGNIGAVAFSPDGLDIVAGGVDGAVRYWHTSSRRSFTGYTGYHGAIYTLAFSRGGRTLVVGGATGAVLLNHGGDDLPTPAAVTSVALSRNGRMIATGGIDGAVRIWNAATGWPTRVISANRGGVQSVAFSADGRLLASGGGDHHVRLWNPATGAPLAALHTTGPVATGVAFSPDGSLLAATSFAENPTAAGQVNAPSGIQVWDTRTRKLLATGKYQYGALAGPAFSPDGSLLAYAIGGSGDQVVLASTRTLGTVAVLNTDSQVHSLAFSPNGRTVVAGGGNGTVTLWDTSTYRRIRSITAGPSPALAVAFSPDGQTLAVGSADFLVRVFSIHTRALIAVLNRHSDEVTSVAFGPDGQTLASASHDGHTLLWNLDPPAAVRRLCQAAQGPSQARQWAGLPGDPGILPCPG